MTCGWLGCDFDSLMLLISALLSGLWSIASVLFLILDTLKNIMFIFFQIVEVIYSIITDPGLLIMFVLTCINFYAAAAGTRKEVAGRYTEGSRKAGQAAVWIFTKIAEMVMGLIQAIIDII